MRILARNKRKASRQGALREMQTVQEFPKGSQELRNQIFYSSPWEGGWWRLGDAVRYMIGASMGMLDLAARYREEVILNRYQAGKEVIERFTHVIKRAGFVADLFSRVPDRGRRTWCTA